MVRPASVPQTGHEGSAFSLCRGNVAPQLAQWMFARLVSAVRPLGIALMTLQPHEGHESMFSNSVVADSRGNVAPQAVQAALIVVFIVVCYVPPYLYYPCSSERAEVY